MPVFFSFWLRLDSVWLNGSFIVMTVLILLYYNRRMGCITGDMLGAMAEIEEAVLLLVACIGVGQ